MRGGGCRGGLPAFAGSRLRERAHAGGRRGLCRGGSHARRLIFLCLCGTVHLSGGNFLNVKGAGVTNPVLVEVLRGTLVESRHRGAVCVVDGDGRTMLEIGDVEAPVFPRSAVKAI